MIWQKWVLLSCFGLPKASLGFLPRTACIQCRPMTTRTTTAATFRDSRTTVTTSTLRLANQEDDSESSWSKTITASPSRSISFSVIMAVCGAALGPFLDSYHSAFGVLQYDEPITAQLWGTELQPALTTAWWVPELFGVAGFLIGWLYVLLDAVLDSPCERRTPAPPSILVGISIFTFQYWLSGVLYAAGVDRAEIFVIMSVVAGATFVTLDRTMAGWITSLTTAVGGPLIEVGLLSVFNAGQVGGGYHYMDFGETGFFPLWIVPVYFLGGPAVGNLARGVWNYLALEQRGETETLSNSSARPRCDVCSDSRAVGCPNCDALGSYVTYGRNVQCNCCKGRGYVICRNCFATYGDDPEDIAAIREIMAKIPD